MTSNNQKSYAQAAAEQGSEDLENDSQRINDIPSRNENQGSGQDEIIDYEDGELEDVMEVDDEADEYPIPQSSKSAGPPHLFPHQQTDNEIAKNQFMIQPAIGALKETASGNDGIDPMKGQAGNGQAAERAMNLAAQPVVGHAAFTTARSSTMDSKHAHITIKSLEEEETKLENLISNLQNQSVDLLISANTQGAVEEAKAIDSRIEMLSNALKRTRENLAYKKQQNDTASVASHPSQTVAPKKSKFKVPLDKIPGFNIEDCDDSTQAYQMKLTNTKGVQTFPTVEDFIDRFESIFKLNDTDISVHWEIGLKQAFDTSLDNSPKLWLKYELKQFRQHYQSWEDMKKKLLKRFMETNTQVAYMFQLLRMRQKPAEKLMHYMQRYVILMSKAKVSDSLFMAVQCYSSLKQYVQNHLKTQLPIYRAEQREGAPTVDADPILPTENLATIIELLESHSTTLHRELATIYEATLEEKEGPPLQGRNNNNKRTHEDTFANKTTGQQSGKAQGATYRPNKRHERANGNESPEDTRPWCRDCNKVRYSYGHSCPEGEARRQRQRAEREAEAARRSGNRTGTFTVRRRSFTEQLHNANRDTPYTIAPTPAHTNVNMVSRRRRPPMHHPVDEDAFINFGASLTSIFNNINNPPTDPQDMMDIVDESMSLAESQTSPPSNGKYPSLLCSMIKTTKKRQMLDTNDILTQNPYSPLSPFLLLGVHRHLALIDSGSDVSLLSEHLCQQHNIPFHPCPHIKITLANNRLAPLLGQTDKIHLKYNGRDVHHSFLVMHELGAAKQALFGCDIFSKLGISLTGIAFNWDDNKVLYDDAIVDEKYVPNISNAGTEHEHEQLLKALEPAIQRNQAINVHELCPHPLAEISLDTIPNKIANRRQYKIAEKMMPIFDDTVKEWLENGVIKRAPPSPWNSPVTFAPKKKGDGTMTFRTCLDVRELNSLLLPTSMDNYSIKLPSDIFKQANGASIYSCIDITTAYLRLPLKSSDQVKTTFQHRNSAYCFVSCPYGITFIGSAWSRLLDDILGDLPFCLTYIDDVYCVTKEDDMELHAKQLQIIIDRLTDNKLILNMSKAHIGKTAIVVLGQTISKQGRSICEKRLTNICEIPYPEHPKALKSCLGMFTYMRDHCPNASALTWRLDALRNIGDTVPIQWTPELKQDFDRIKQVLSTRLVLSPVNPTLPLIVAVDASDHALGTCLFQRLVLTEPNPIEGETPITVTKVSYIAFHSRSLSKSERNWHVQRRELAAIAMALKLYDDFLFGRHFTLYSDHRSLTFLFTQQPINEHFVDYFDTLLRHSFDIHHISGIQNVLPDFLSRLYYFEDSPTGGDGSDAPKAFQQRKGFTLINPSESDESSFRPKDVQAYQPTESAKVVAFVQATHKFSEQNYVIVPESKRKQILKETHMESGHFGADNIVKSIRNQNMNWPGLLQNAIDTVSSCTICAKFNIKKKGYSPTRSIYCYLPGDGYVMDLAGPFSSVSNVYTYLLVMVDVCTRFVILKPLVDKTAKTVAAQMIDAFGVVGLPRFFVASDHGAEWANQLHTMLFQSMEVDKRYSTQYHPQGNGVSERYVGTVKKTLAKLINGNIEDWHNYLPICALLLNNKISKKLQSSPFSLMFARNMNAPINYYDKEGNPKSKRYMTNEEMLKRIDYMSQLVFPAIAEQHQRYTDRLNGKIDENNVQVNFKPGTYVMHKILNKTNAFAPSYVGPYQVIRQNAGGAYILRDEEGTLMSRNYVATELKAINQEEIIPKSELFEVEAIIQDNGNPQNQEYLVKWKNYNKEHNSWVKAADFTDTEFIIDYWKKVKKDHAGRTVNVNKIISDKRKQVKNHLKNDFAPSQIYERLINSPEVDIDSLLDNVNTQSSDSHKKSFPLSADTPISSPKSRLSSQLSRPSPVISRPMQAPDRFRRITRQMARQNPKLSPPNAVEIQHGKRKFGPLARISSSGTLEKKQRS